MQLEITKPRAGKKQYLFWSNIANHLKKMYRINKLKLLNIKSPSETEQHVDTIRPLSEITEHIN